MRITTESFFNHYIIHPNAKELNPLEKIIAHLFSVILFPLTIAVYLWKNRNINLINLKERGERLANLAASIERITFPLLHIEQEQNMPISQEEIPSIINETFINQYYSRKLPPRHAVTVPWTNPQTDQQETRLWKDLTRKEKVSVINTGTHQHNQVPFYTPEFFANIRFFTTHGQKSFIKGDPRQSHGNDHCIRAAIFAGVFACLYQKYHPDYTVTQQEIILSQLAAAGHDAGRQTEGPDVYDRESSEKTVNELSSLGVNDPELLDMCGKAIAEKDAPPTIDKNLIAKCVQNADSVEFVRLQLDSKKQKKSEFEKSRSYLDIYRELQNFAEKRDPNQPQAVILKNGLTFQDFCTELDHLREEMNDFIYQTHSRKFRQEAVKSDNYYQTVLNVVNPTEFGLLYTILLKTGIKKPPPSYQDMVMQTDRDNASAWLKYGVDKISTSSLETIEYALINNRDFDAAVPFRIELEKRRSAIENFENEEQKVPLDPTFYIQAYALLPPIVKASYRDRFQEKLKDSIQGDLIPFLQQRISQIPAIFLQTPYRNVLVDALQLQLKKLLEVKNPNARNLEFRAVELLREYNLVDESGRDQEVQTTAALALHQAAEIHLRLHQKEEATRVLNVAAQEIMIDPTSPFYDLDRLFAEEENDASLYLTMDCGYLRKRKMRIATKEIEQGTGTNKYYELSYELPPKGREELTRMLNLIPKHQKSIVTAKFFAKQKGIFHSKSGLKIGKDLKIAFGRIEVYVGNNPHLWNQYHLMRIRIPLNTPIQKVHEALSLIGLPMALMPTRAEDSEKEILSRSLAIRCPAAYYAKATQKNRPSLVYTNLSEEDKALVDNDCKKAKVTQVRKDHYEIVQPEIGQEAWNEGVRSVGTFIQAGYSIADAAQLLKAILKSGLQSSQERFQNGLLNNGCAPLFNNKTGSANQVFTRILTKNLFDRQFSLENFPIQGHLFIMMSPQVLERLPYIYLHDRGGVRNPLYSTKVHYPRGGEIIYHFRGDEKIEERKGFTETIQELGNKTFPLNEAMFDLNIGAKYIQKILVESEEDRFHLLSALQKSQIYHIGTRLIEEVILVADKLTPDLVEGFNDEEMPNNFSSLEYI